MIKTLDIVSQCGIIKTVKEGTKPMNEKLYLKVDRQIKQLGKWITYERQEWIGTLEQMRAEQSTREIIGAVNVEDIQKGIMSTRKTGDYARELIELKEVK